MKKLVCLMIALMICSSALAEDVHGLPSAYDFEPLFENAAELTGSGHQITSKNLTSFKGEIRCIVDGICLAIWGITLVIEIADKLSRKKYS